MWDQRHGEVHPDPLTLLPPDVDGRFLSPTVELPSGTL
jgi:hypothetical protein